jgi:hypothetical protein
MTRKPKTLDDVYAMVARMAEDSVDMAERANTKVRAEWIAYASVYITLWGEIDHVAQNPARHALGKRLNAVRAR